MIISMRDSGMTLIETMIAVLIALVGVFSLGNVIFVATVLDKNHGAESTRATIYAQDKIENLLSLDFVNCTKSSGLQPASCNSTGISASGWTQGLLAGGAVSPLQLNCPAGGSSVGYVDYLDGNGLKIVGSDCSAVNNSSVAYVRQWQIQNVASSGPALKQVTVAVYSTRAVTGVGAKPIAVLTSVISDPN
jgi:hypothetical protein